MTEIFINGGQHTVGKMAWGEMTINKGVSAEEEIVEVSSLLTGDRKRITKLDQL
jgi:hypothetical protein